MISDSEYLIEPTEEAMKRLKELNERSPKETMWTMFEKVVKNDPEKPSVLIRDYDDKSKKFFPYKQISVKEIYELSSKFGSGLKKLGLKALDNVFVTTNHLGWEISIIRAALYRQSANFFPASIDNLAFREVDTKVLTTFSPKMIILESGRAIDIMKNFKDIKSQMAKEKYITTVIVLPNVPGTEQTKDNITEDMYKLAKELDIKIYHYQDIFKIGEENPSEPEEQNPDNIASILLSSGTTSNFKASIYTHKRLILTMYYYIDSFVLKLNKKEDNTKYTAIFLPFYFGHLSDIIASSSFLFPELYNIYQSNGVNAGEDLSMSKLRLFIAGSSNFIKIYNLAQSKIISGIPENQVIYFIKNKVFGGNMEIIVNTSSYLPTYIMKWYSEKLGIRVWSHYCMTEVPIIISDYINFSEKKDIPEFILGYRPRYGLVKIKKVDNSEIKFKENINGSEIITGEMLIKSDINIKEFYKDELLTKQKIDDEGYFHSGDLVSWDCKEERFIFKSRIDDLVKIHCGYLYPTALVENEFLDHPLFKNVVVYCDNEDDNIFCITCLNIEFLSKFKNLSETLKNKFNEYNKLKDDDKKKLFENEEVKNIINEQMNKFYEEKVTLELVKFTDIIINYFNCSFESGMLTRTGKVCRKKIIKKFMNDIIEFRKKNKS